MADSRNTSVNPLGAALVGAAVGAAAVFLSNKENRKKLKKSIDDVRHDGEKTVKELRNTVDQKAEEGKEKLSDTLDEAQKRINGNGKTTRRRSE